MDKELKKELNIILESSDNSDSPYNRLDDKNLPKVGMKRKPVLKLKDINRLKKIRNQKREEIAQDSVFIPYLYGPQESQEPGGMGGLGM